MTGGAPAAATPCGPSVLDPIAPAWAWMVRILFRPFDIVRWLSLGFMAWLARCGESGGWASSRWELPDQRYASRAGESWDWALGHLILAAILVSLVVVIALVVWGLVTWLSSRFKFLFVEGVLSNRAAVVEPWHRFREQGNALFVFRIALGLLIFGVLLVTVVLMAASLVAAGLGEHEPGPLGILVLVFWGLALFGLGLLFVLVTLVVNDLLVPIMWVRGCGVLQAWAELGGLLRQYPGSFVLYVIARLLVGLVVGVLTCAATCVTCCLAAFPYVGTVLLLPLHVFVRAYPLYFLSQCGDAYTSLGPREA